MNDPGLGEIIQKSGEQVTDERRYEHRHFRLY